MDSKKPAGHRRVNRGDPATYDFIFSGIAQDGLWHDLDCSSIVPVGAVAIELVLVAKHSDPGLFFSVRTKGNVNTVNVHSVKTMAADIPIKQRAFVDCGSDRILEYSAQSTTFTLLLIVVSAWELA